MSTWALMGVVVGALIGAPARLVIDHWVSTRTVHLLQAPRAWQRMPWGLLTVNIAGSFLLGIVLGSTSGSLRVALAAGLCGSFTTFSSFAWQSYQALRNDRPAFWLGVACMAAGCVTAFGLAYSVTRAVIG